MSSNHRQQPLLVSGSNSNLYGSESSLPVLQASSTNTYATTKSSSSARHAFPFAVQDPNVLAAGNNNNNNNNNNTGSKPSTPSSAVGYGSLQQQHQCTTPSSSAAHTPSKPPPTAVAREDAENTAPPPLSRLSGIHNSNSNINTVKIISATAAVDAEAAATDDTGAGSSSRGRNNINNNKASSRGDHHADDDQANPLLEFNGGEKGDHQPLIIPDGEVVAAKGGASPDDDDSEEVVGDEAPPVEHHHRVNQLYRSAIFAVIPVFCAYAGFITLQRSIKTRLNIDATDKQRSDLFGTAVSMLYIANGIFRLMHNILFCFLEPRQRVMLSYVCLATAHMTLFLSYWVWNSKEIVWTFIAYFLGGVGIGSFESNLLSTIAPLGHGTKSWAVLGIPIGFNIVAVGIYIVFAAVDASSGGEDTWLHALPWVAIAIGNLMGLAFWIFGLPNIEFDGSHENIRVFKENLLHWREWMPKIWMHCLTLSVDMLFVSMFTSLCYYTYDLENVPLWPYAKQTIPKNVFQTWFNLMNFAGDFTGRRVAYLIRPRKQVLPFLVLSFIGGALILSKVAIIAPFGIFLIMFLNGLAYCVCTKWVDSAVDDRYILTALSFWLLIGDVGSSMASLLVQPINGWLGSVPMYDAGVQNATVMNNVTLLTTTIAAAVKMF